MAAKASFLEEELCCSVCCEIFTDPVVLECSHSFCRVCLQQYWGVKSSRVCPVCRRKSLMENPPVSLALKNIVESYLKEKSDSEPVEKTEVHCIHHGKELLFFCEDDMQPLCIVCQTSKKHRHHQICPLEEAVPDLKFQAQNTESQIKTEFEKFRQFLQNEEEARLAALREEEEQKCQLMKDQIESFTRPISTLSATITAIEKSIEAEDAVFLKTYEDAKRRVQCTLQDPELPSGALIDVAKHLGNLKFRVWEKMQETVQYTPVILDPNTMSSVLCLSDDLTCVRLSEAEQQIPDNPERITFGRILLGSEGFTSGKHSWEVELGDKPAWTIGVVQESITRKVAGMYSPKGGFWVIQLRNGGDYRAGGVTDFTLKRKPQSIRVELDYDRGKVSFFDSSDRSHIYTFKDTFTERIFPYFNPYPKIEGRNIGALQICPISVTVVKAQ